MEQVKKHWDNLKASTSRVEVHYPGRWWWEEEKEEEEGVVMSKTDRGGELSQVQMRWSLCSDESQRHTRQKWEENSRKGQSGKSN